MNKNWIPLQSIPAHGKSFVLDDQAGWQEPLDEFGLNCRIVKPLRAEIFVLPQEQGVLFRGTIEGKVLLPCDRCADDSEVPIKHSFDSFEPYPANSLLASEKDTRVNAGRKPQEYQTGADDTEPLDYTDDAVVRNMTHGRGLEINPAALAWEEFSLTLPVHPLCRDDCKGLCPVCGNNKNTDTCSCKKEQGDPRMAALRDLAISKK